MGLTLWFNNHVKSELSRRTIQVIIDQYLRDSDETLELDKNSLTDISNFKESLDLFELPDEYENLSFRDVLTEAYRDFRYSLYSNGGFWTRPFPRETDYEFTKETVIQSVSPYKICYHSSLDSKKLYIYSRGSKVVLNYDECLPALIDLINKGNQLTMHIVNDILHKDWDENINFYILNLLYLHHGINIVN